MTVNSIEPGSKIALPYLRLIHMFLTKRTTFFGTNSAPILAIRRDSGRRRGHLATKGALVIRKDRSGNVRWIRMISTVRV